MRAAHEGDHDIALGCFVQDNFGVAGHDHLRGMLGGNLIDEIVDLALAENFEVGIRFIEEQDGVGIVVEIGEQESGLLQAAAGGGQVELNAAEFTITHSEFAAFGKVIWWQQLDAEKGADAGAKFQPAVVGFPRVDTVAEVAQDFGGASLADKHTNFAGLLAKFLSCESRHGGKEDDMPSEGGIEECRASFHGIRPIHCTAVDGFFIGIVEFEGETPRGAVIDSLNGNGEGYIGGFLLTLGP